MKKFLSFMLSVSVITVCFSGCTGTETDSTENISSVSSNETITNEQKIETTLYKIVESTAEGDESEIVESNDNNKNVTLTDSDVIKPKSEYVETYYIYAEQGAIITKTDSKTGEYKWKGKCESCGNADNTEYIGTLKHKTAKQTSAFVCKNPECDL